MRLIFLGVGSAFVTDPNNYHSNLLLESNAGQRLLIDCGSDVRRSLHALNLDYEAISNVYISHLHADHVGGLEWLAFSRKFCDKQLSKPDLYLCETMVRDLWDHSLSGGLTSLSDEIAELSSYFSVHGIPPDGQFTWQSIIFQLVKHIHVHTDYADMPSFGLYFKVNDKTIYLTTDAQFQPENSAYYYENADLIFQDCETKESQSGVHAHYTQLKTLDPHIKQKMWLYHYNQNDTPDAVADGFAGFVKPGQSFELS